MQNTIPARICAIAAAFLCTMTALAGGTAAAGQPRMEIDIASTLPTSMPILGLAVVDVADRVATMSNGQLVPVPHEPNALVPAGDTVNAVSEGRIAADWAGAGWFSGRDTRTQR